MKKSMTLDPQKLREAMRAWSSGVTVVAAEYGGERHGMTVSSFTSVALDPPLIIISLQTASRTHDMVLQAGSFSVTILSAGQKEMSERFAGRSPDSEKRFSELETETLVTGAPCIKGGLSCLDCQVVQMIPVGTNTLFLAEVVAVQGNGKGQPLVYHDRNYRLLEE